MSSGRTEYTGIDQVPPQHLLLVDGPRTTQHGYWVPERSASREAGSLEETAAPVRSLLRDAVRPALNTSSRQRNDGLG